MCNNREKLPWTCCCGCSLKCGIITYAVFVCLELLGAFCTMQIAPIIFSALSLLPLIALWCSPDSWGIRLWNYVWQAIMMLAVVIGGVVMIITLVGATAVVADVSNAAQQSGIDTSGATSAVAGTLGIMMAIALGIMVPLQALWLCIFKAHFEALAIGKLAEINESLV